MNAGGTAPPSVLPDISPTRGEIGRHRRFRQSPALNSWRRRRNRRSPPCGGDARQGRGGCPDATCTKAARGRIVARCRDRT
ncbi:MAG: hypothetical protein EOR51_06055 [Mesorhizobium sp.]|nr:MAG: hypothetical protein EOR51_06055 [Mesorhizobium sp.]